MPNKEQKPNGRMKQLLIKCAENLENGCDPLNHQFLVDNSVTLDECHTLAQQMAVAIKGYAQAPQNLVLQIIFASEFKGEEQETMLNALDHVQRQKGAIDQLRKITKKI